MRAASVATISPHATEAADRYRWIAISPAWSQPKLRITSDPVSIALNVLRTNSGQNVSLALYAKIVSFDQLLALGTA